MSIIGFLLLLITTIIFNAKQLLKILLFLEIFGIIWYLSLISSTNIGDGGSLFIFRLLVLEGVLALYGLIILTRIRGRRFINLNNVS